MVRNSRFDRTRCQIGPSGRLIRCGRPRHLKWRWAERYAVSCRKRFGVHTFLHTKVDAVFVPCLRAVVRSVVSQRLYKFRKKRLRALVSATVDGSPELLGMDLFFAGRTGNRWCDTVARRFWKKSHNSWCDRCGVAILGCLLHRPETFGGEGKSVDGEYVCEFVGVAKQVPRHPHVAAFVKRCQSKFLNYLSEPTRFDCTTLLKGGGGGKWWESMSKWVDGWVDEPLKEARNV